MSRRETLPPGTVLSMLGKPLPSFAEFEAHAHEQFKHWKRVHPGAGAVAVRFDNFMAGYTLRMAFYDFVLEYCNAHRACTSVPCTCTVRYPEWDVEALRERIYIANEERTGTRGLRVIAGGQHGTLPAPTTTVRPMLRVVTPAGRLVKPRKPKRKAAAKAPSAIIQFADITHEASKQVQALRRHCDEQFPPGGAA